MEIRFDSRVAVVTGAGTGLGRAHAHLLAARGASVVVNDLKGPSGERSMAETVVEEIRAAGGTAVACHESVAEEASAARIIETAMDSFGRIDIVVNNAGILRDKSFAKMEMADFDLVLRVHLYGTAYVTKAAWSRMLAQKYGRVVFTSSASGLAQAYGQANYGAAKAGMIGLMNSLKSEGSKSNLFVNTLCPLATTQMTEDLLPESIARLSLPEFVSPAVGWLCSEACTMNGEIVAAGAGHFALIKVMKSEGAVLDVTKGITIEDFASRMATIEDMSDALPYQGTLDSRTKSRMGI